jgi:hypothetical protein
MIGFPYERAFEEDGLLRSLRFDLVVVGGEMAMISCEEVGVSGLGILIVE